MPGDVGVTPQQSTSEDPSKKWERNNATWYLNKKGPWIYIIARLDLLPREFYKPGAKKDGPVPVHPMWRSPAWIIAFAFPPILIQMLWYYLVPSIKWHTAFYWLFLFISHGRYLKMLIRHLHHWIKHYGVLDHENSGRDIPRDNEVFRLSVDILLFMLVRTGIVTFLGGYDSNVPPTIGIYGASLTSFTVLKMVAWFIALDFFFYIYHRSCHEVPFLWKIHAKHHGTKHPTPLQALLAGDYQEVIELFLVPALATLVVPMNSYELWMVECTLVYIEALGHSGARAYWGNPILHPFLEPLGLGLIIEDHDLHHRNGKSGRSYGKQSLIWDRLFGTVGTRIECTQKNVAF